MLGAHPGEDVSVEVGVSAQQVERPIIAALALRFPTSIVGVAAYAILSLRASGSIPPDVGVGIGVGGLLGGFLGASIQPRVPEELLQRGLGVLALGLGVRYGLLAL